MKLSPFEKFAIQMIKDTWRVMVIGLLLFGVLLWSMFTLIEKMIQ